MCGCGIYLKKMMMREICHFDRFFKILQAETDGIVQFQPEIIYHNTIQSIDIVTLYR